MFFVILSVAVPRASPGTEGEEGASPHVCVWRRGGELTLRGEDRGRTVWTISRVAAGAAGGGEGIIIRHEEHLFHSVLGTKETPNLQKCKCFVSVLTGDHTNTGRQSY